MSDVEKKDGAVTGVVRWVVTKRNENGSRTMAMPASQGRYTHGTREEAERELEIFRSSWEEKLGYEGLEPRSVMCWPDHHDPKGVWFMDPAVVVNEEALEGMRDLAQELGGTWAAYRNDNSFSPGFGSLQFLRVEGGTFEVPSGWEYRFEGIVNLSTGRVE
jgi:hypothetical protein